MLETKLMNCLSMCIDIQINRVVDKLTFYKLKETVTKSLILQLDVYEISNNY